VYIIHKTFHLLKSQFFVRMRQMAILFALISYIGWAFADTLWAVVVRRISAYSALFWSCVISLLVFSLYAPFVFSQLTNISVWLLCINIVLAFALLAGNICFSKAMQETSASLAGTIGASFSAVTLLLSIIFFKENITLYQAMAIVIIFVGIVLTTLNLKEVTSKKFTLDRGILFAIGAMLLWGIYFAFIKIPIDVIGWFWPNYIAFVVMLLAIFSFSKAKKYKLKIPATKNIVLFLMAGSLLARVAEFSFNYAISSGLTSIVAPIAGSYPTLFVVLTFIFFKDKITKQQIGGIITTLIGIVLLSIFSA
jgi:drug/metabolite transporter (DMT)-like permease